MTASIPPDDRSRPAAIRLCPQSASESQDPANGQAVDLLFVQDIDWLVTLDGQRPDHSRRGDRGGWGTDRRRRKTRDLAGRFRARKKIDGKGMLALPGLIDTHVHNSQQLGRGLADGCDIPVHLLQRLYGYEAELLEEDAYWAAIQLPDRDDPGGHDLFPRPRELFPPPDGARREGNRHARRDCPHRVRRAIDDDRRPVEERAPGVRRRGGFARRKRPTTPTTASMTAGFVSGLDCGSPPSAPTNSSARPSARPMKTESAWSCMRPKSATRSSPRG